jgi:hypothetical protein
MTAPAMEVAVTNGHDDAEARRKLTLLKAVGLDRVNPEQRELALAIAKRYELDLLLKHLVLIDGKPYVTRDALLWIAHRSGQLDGIEVTEPEIVGEFWTCKATVYRKDMSRPFTYSGRYPTKGGNQKFAPEMCVKVAESMALRRAFNISAPTQDERWDVDVPAQEPEQPKSLAEKVAEKAQAVQTAPEPATDAVGAAEAIFEGEIVTEGASPLEQALEAMPEDSKAKLARCESMSPLADDGEEPEQCRREEGHTGVHRTAKESWR